MTEDPIGDTKMVVLPATIVDRLQIVAMRQGCSLTDFATASLRQALRADEMGTDLGEAVDHYQLVQIQRGAGAVSLTRSGVLKLIDGLNRENPEKLHDIWGESGRWYGSYLLTKLGQEEALEYLDKSLLVSWNLDEVDLTRGDREVTIRVASFHMTKLMTDLLTTYINGVMESLDYTETHREVLRGLCVMSFRKNIRIRL